MSVRFRLAEAPFDVADKELLPKAGPCTTCSKRTGNQPELFSDVKSADVCTEPSCFQKKVQRHHCKSNRSAAGNHALRRL